ncbi:MAG: DinB family protein [Acidobacteria bacterium]|nr:DinB family protein [Acidobacteriota bacterium]
MSELERLQDQFKRLFNGPAWHGPALLELLQDLSALEARTRPLPGVHSPGELLRHMLAWRQLVIHRLRGDDAYRVSDAQNWAGCAADEAEWTSDLEAFRASQRELMLLLGRFNPGLLDVQAPGSDVSWYTLFHGLLQHDIYHLGQIGMLKRALRG